MMSGKSPLSRFEDFARELVEGSFDRLFGQPGPLVDVANALVNTALASQRNGLVDNRYLIKLHPETLLELNRQTSYPAGLLQEMLIKWAGRERMVFAGDVSVELAPDPAVEVGLATILPGRDEEDKVELTAVLQRRKGGTSPLKMPEAYLIIGGRRHVTLSRAVNTIGRALDNDIVLEDQGVSRTHAQIRWRHGQFVIFDLGSRSGTLVNGRRCSEQPLASGDVIKLGSAAIIYGEEDGKLGEDPGGSGRAGDTAGANDSATVNDITQELSVDDF